MVELCTNTLISAKLQIWKGGQKRQSWWGEVLNGGEGQHWTVVSSKKEKKKNRFLEKLWDPNTEHRWNGDSRKPKYSHKHVSHCQFTQHEFHVYSRVTDPNRLTAISMPSYRHSVRTIANVHNISVKVRVCWSCPTLGGFREYLVFGTDLRLQICKCSLIGKHWAHQSFRIVTVFR
jgi:hypothetical protein